jgi:regulator of sirC expression with transglutaminase-like and TPR domain
VPVSHKHLKTALFAPAATAPAGLLGLDLKTRVAPPDDHVVESNTDRLKRVLHHPGALGLAEAALLIAQDEYPALDVDAYLKRLDELAARVRAELPAGSGVEETIVTLNHFLFVEQGFAGNTDDYYDPRNSFLNEVLDRKLGIPITLSILYLEIGQRLGLPFEGVSFPGHFLVKYPTEGGDLVLDPFSGGTPLSEDDLQMLLDKTFGEATEVPPLNQLLNAAGKREILVRMLRNLKGVYQHHGRTAKVLNAVNRILLIAPDQPVETLERARLYDQMECVQAALADYERYLAIAPAAAPEIGRRAAELRLRVARLN